MPIIWTTRYEANDVTFTVQAVIENARYMHRTVLLSMKSVATGLKNACNLLEISNETQIVILTVM